MHRTDGDSHVSNQFSEGDPLVPRPPTQLGSVWLNAVQEEIANVIEAVGIALVKGTNNQLISALVLKATDQTIAGLKTFTSSLTAVGAAASGLPGLAGFGGTSATVPGPGVYGRAGAKTGGGTSTAPGVLGEAQSLGPGVKGSATTPFTTQGVLGERDSTGSGEGVRGRASGVATQTSYGVVGELFGGHVAGWIRAAVLGDGSGASGYGVVARGATTTPVYAAFRIEPQGAAPTAPEEGALYVNSTDHKLYIYNGTAWVVVGTQT